MKILLLVNNWVGWQITSWLKGRGDEIVGLVLHPAQKRKYGNEIITSIDMPAIPIFDGSRLDEVSILSEIASVEADIALSILFDYILHDEFIRLFSKGVINLHPAYLPYNRGQYPNVWSIVDDTPAGVTLHYIDTGIDTGDIIVQKEVPVVALETGETLYRKLEKTCLDVFIETWPLIVEGKSMRTQQLTGEGTYHRANDVDRIDEIDLNQSYSARKLINTLRARTFPPYQGAYFWDGDRKVYLRLKLLYEDEL